jgi:hypothetical protein
MTMPTPGDFGVKPGGGLAMWLVRLGTFSRYGHAAVVVGTWHGTDLPVKIVEATPKGVVERWCHASEFRWSDGGPTGIGLSDLQRHHITATATAYLGRGYDWPSIGGFLVRFFGAKFGYSPDHPDSKLMCSELVVWAYKVAGIDLFPGTAPGDVSPGMLVDFCPRSPGGKP